VHSQCHVWGPAAEDGADLATMDDARQGTREKCREWAANMAL